MVWKLCSEGSTEAKRTNLFCHAWKTPLIQFMSMRYFTNQASQQGSGSNGGGLLMTFEWKHWYQRNEMFVSRKIWWIKDWGWLRVNVSKLKMISQVELIIALSVSCHWCNFSIRQSREKVISKSKGSKKKLSWCIKSKLHTLGSSFLTLYTSLSSPSHCSPGEIQHNVIPRTVKHIKNHRWGQMMKEKPKLRANE